MAGTGRRDEIDMALAKHFAWSFVPVDRPELAAEKVEAAALEAASSVDEPDEPAVDERGAEEFRAKARASCRPLAEAIAGAWACGDEEARVRLTKRLLVRAERLGVSLVGMIEWPVEAVRLLRLTVALGARATRKQRERAATVASLLPLDHPEAADLLVEVARAGDKALADAIFCEDDWTPDVGDPDALMARLADVLDEGPTHAARAVAIELISRFDDRGPAVGALRRALHLPSFAVRARALDALATAEPCAVAAEDLVHVLRDLVAHAPPEALIDEAREEDERTFADAVLQALKHVQPEEAGEALLDWIDAAHDSVWLDAGWATEALALGYPETGAVMADHWLKCARGYDRVKAVAAMQRLPNEMAEPRLRLAASDPSFSVHDAARHQWLQRFGQSCPVGAESLIGASLLPGKPSDRFLSRLSVIHGRIAEAKRAMGRVLVHEAPDPEALVLLLQVVADDAESHEPAFGRADGWAVTLVERFGALGVAGLRALAERYPEPECFGWMRRIADLVERGVIAREHTAPLRELAAAHVLSEDSGHIDDSLRLLTLVGPPPELLDRVMTLALTDELGAWEARKLVAAWPDRAVDPRLVSDMALALADRDWSRLEYAAWMGLSRDISAARVVAQRVIEVACETEDALNAAVICARGLRERQALDEDWAVAAASRPESPLFAIAARVWGRDSRAVRERLEAALGSPARQGGSAAEAAIALVNGQPRLPIRDKRLRAVLTNAPPPERAELFVSMCVHSAPFSALAEHLESLFTSGDLRVTTQLMGITGWLKSAKAHAMLRQLLPRVVDPDLRADIEEQLGEVPEPYWAEG
jgi:hypothetical protein